MGKVVSENTVFSISVKTLIGIGFAMATVISMWFVLQSQIAEAKELPRPDITRTEFDLKDEMIRQTIMNTQEDVKEIKERMIRIEDKINELR